MSQSKIAERMNRWGEAVRLQSFSIGVERAVHAGNATPEQLARARQKETDAYWAAMEIEEEARAEYEELKRTR